MSDASAAVQRMIGCAKDADPSTQTMFIYVADLRALLSFLQEVRADRDALTAERDKLRSALEQIAGCQMGHRVDVVGLARAALGETP